MASNTKTKNLRHGRLLVKSGDTPPLSLLVAFAEGDFEWTRTRNVIQGKDRHKLDHLRKGEDEPVEFSFTAKFVDKQLFYALDKSVWIAQTQNVTGITPQTASQLNVDKPYEQGSLVISTAGFTKLANGTTPTADGEYSESAGTLDVNDVISVPATNGLNVQTPAGVTEIDFTYDAVGASSFEPDCSDIKTVELCYEIVDPADLVTVVQRWELKNVVVESVTFSEAEDFTTIAFEGIAYVLRPEVTLG